MHHRDQTHRLLNTLLRELPVLKREGKRREEAGNKARNEMEVCSEMGERAEKKGRVHVGQDFPAGMWYPFSVRAFPSVLGTG